MSPNVTFCIHSEEINFWRLSDGVEGEAVDEDSESGAARIEDCET